jgi:apolipoprotein N-acyltransferase
MDPTVGRVAFTLGFTVFGLALSLLPWLEPDSPEFVVNLLALGMSGLFLLVVIFAVRLAARTSQFHYDEPEGSEEPELMSDNPVP